MASVAFKAAGDVYRSRFVKITAAHTVGLSTTDTELIHGVTSDAGRHAPTPDNGDAAGLAAKVGEIVTVWSNPGDEALLEYGATVAAGVLLMTDSTGRGITATTGKQCGAIAIEAGAVGELRRVQLRQQVLA